MKHLTAPVLAVAIAVTLVLALPAPAVAGPSPLEGASVTCPVPDSPSANAATDRPIDDAAPMGYPLCPNPNPGVDCSDYNTPFCLYAGDWDCFNGCCLPSPDSPGGLNCPPVCGMIE